MADLKQLKIMRDEDFDHRDPLAELTRIMGYAPQSAPNADDFDDFGIDLEAELLGAFDSDDRPLPAPANASAPLPAPVFDEAPAYDAAADTDLEDAISAMFEPIADHAVARAAPSAEVASFARAEPTAPAEAMPDAPEAGLYEIPEPEDAMAQAPAEAFEDTAAVEEAFSADAEAFEPVFDESAFENPVSGEDESGFAHGFAEPEPETEFVPEPVEAGRAEPEPFAAAVGAPEAEDEPDVTAAHVAEIAAPAPVLEAEAVQEPIKQEPPAAAASAPEPIFDPFAELAAMAAYSADRASSLRARDETPAVEPAPAVAPAPAELRADPPRLYSRANIVAPAAFAAAAAPVARAFPVEPETTRHAVVEPVFVADEMPEAAEPAPVDIDRALDEMIASHASGGPSARPAAGVAADLESFADERDPDDFAANAGSAFDDGSLDAAFEDAALLDDFLDEEPFAAKTADPVAPAASAPPSMLGSSSSPRGRADEPIDDLDRVLDDMLGDFGAELDSPANGADGWAAPDHGQPAWSLELEEPVAPAAPSRAHSASPAAAPAWDFGGPDFETVEVPEHSVEPADELDIPDLAFEDDLPVAAQPDELELQFASAFADLSDAPARQPSYHEAAMAAATAAAAATVRRPNAMPLDDHGRSPARGSTNAGHHAPARHHHAEDYRHDRDRDIGAGVTETSLEAALAEWPLEEVDASALHDDELASAFHGAAPHHEAAAPRRGRRGLMVAALVAGVAVAGGVAAFAFMRGGGETDPVVVRADPAPVKVRPETPGGVTVPNQDKAVYERVAGAQNDETPTQETLVSAREEPVALDIRDVTPISEGVADEDVPAAPALKSEDRVEAADDDLAAPAEEAPVVAPRRVRTMVVRADGTLVPREEPAPVVEAPAPTAPAELARPLVEEPAPVAIVEEEAPVVAEEVAPPPAVEAPAEQVVAAAPAAPEPPVRRVETTTITPENAAASQRMPDRGPVAPTRPSEQPVEIVGNANRAGNAQTQVAAVQPAPAPVAAATSEWAMQIASQPTPEGAQASYADLARRHGAILGGRGVNIVKADIPGKGTFWRVRIPASNRAEAVSLCERYKAAGGSCFVAR